MKALVDRTAASDIGGIDGTVAVSAAARAALFLFCLAVPLDVVPASVASTTSITFYAGVVLAAAGAWQVAVSGSLRKAPASLLLVTGYTAWALASVLWAHDTERALARFNVNLMLLAAVWLGWQIAYSRRDVRLMAAGYIGGCAIAAVGAWQSFLSGTAYAQYQDRYSGMGYDPNDMGVTLSLAMPLAAYLATTGGGRRAYLWLAYLPLGMSAIVLSGSRGAALTAIAAVGGVALWLSRRSRVVTITLLALLAGAVAVVAVRTPETLERVFTIRQQLAGGTLSDRRNIWRAGLRVFAGDPLLGVGTGQFAMRVAPELGHSVVAHNAFISVMVELGVIGLALYASAFGALVRRAWEVVRNERMLVLTLLGTWLVGVSSLTWELRKATWFVLLLCSVVVTLGDDEEARSPTP